MTSITYEQSSIDFELKRVRTLRKECLYCGTNPEYNKQFEVIKLGDAAIYWSFYPLVPGQLTLITRRHEASFEKMSEGFTYLNRYRKKLDDHLLAYRKLFPAIYTDMLDRARIGENSDWEAKSRERIEEMRERSYAIKDKEGVSRIISFGGESEGLHGKIDFLPRWSYLSPPELEAMADAHNPAEATPLRVLR